MPRGQNPEFLEQAKKSLDKDFAREMQRKSAENRVTFRMLRKSFEVEFAKEVNTSVGTMTKADALKKRIVDEAIKGNYKFVELALRVLGMKDPEEDGVQELVVRFVSSGIIPASSEQEVRERNGLLLEG